MATLLQYVLFALPLYTIASIYLPNSLIHWIEKELHAFLWGHPSTHQGLHRIAWNKIYVAKKFEDLGNTFLYDRRTQCLCKLASQLLDTNSL